MSKIDTRQGYKLRYRISPKHITREIKYFIQRGLYGYDETYWYSFDYHIAELISDVLPKLKDGTGIPMFYLAEVDPEWGFAKKTKKSTMNKAQKLRNKEIDFIADALSKYNESGSDDDIKKAIELFAKRFGSWWD